MGDRRPASFVRPFPPRGRSVVMKFLNRFRGNRAAVSQPAAHMTWGSGSLARTASRTSVFLRTQIWIRPLIALVILAAIGFGMRRAIESTMKENLRSDLQTLLNVEV